MLARVAPWPLLACNPMGQHMTHLTYSERERVAYCAGHTRAADLLGALADYETEPGELIERLQDIVAAWRAKEFTPSQAIKAISNLTDTL